MGHEAIIHGRIVGASWRSGDRFFWLHDLNCNVLARIPAEDDWPWVVRGIFALPASHPEGTYRRQIIHFGLSIKDDPQDHGIWDVWLGKFEVVLRQLYWWSALVHLETEFGPPRLFQWTPTEEAMQGLYDDPPRPVTEWSRSVRILE